ncbi:uncharacterized protein STEHIDRAFT_160727 [Stereum hirsutum FP-91666 SS1]|uniref:uncharacterized protein n=1 Tax=Stereum hirsutum (strain FP-91666) TaxID=721885 RepID=UPI0004449CEC|nr:uncharacterized protein STEHIDRAFT_160727 [Stereum hirsutum FP-91666 SS1]EIM83124.1 hypothetical protein STEHIDRAFT_160727 [Stereum hirsutum FP-91666 SS1]
MSTCRGCAKTFKRDSDLTRHLWNSKDQRCALMAQEEFGYVPRPGPDVEMEDTDVWMGDFFGSRDQYNDTDFPTSIEDIQNKHTCHFSCESSVHAGPSHFSGAISSSDEEGEGAGLPVPGLEEIKEPKEEDEDDGEDNDSDIDDIDVAHIARLVNRIGGLSLPTSRAPSPSLSESSSSSSLYVPSSSSSSSSSRSTDGLSEEFGHVLDDDEL